MHQKRRFAKSLQHKATLMEEVLRHDNVVIPYAPPPAQLMPATPPPPESPNQQPPPEVKRAVRRLGIGDQQSAESSPPPALECFSSPASVQDWLPMDNYYASASFLLNKCPLVILTVDAASSPRTYIAGPITSISKQAPNKTFNIKDLLYRVPSIHLQYLDIDD